MNSSEISNLTPQLSPNPKLRRVILNLQRELTLPKGWIVIGRDITSEFLPNAKIKIFLTVNLEIRVKRRSEQLKENISSQEIKTSLKKKR